MRLRYPRANTTSQCRSSTQRTFSCCEETMSVRQSTASMAFMMSASGGIISGFGKPSLTASTACQFQHLWMRRYDVPFFVSMQHLCTSASVPHRPQLPAWMQILCMHGGLSPELKTLEQIKRLARPADVPDTGLLCDLLWADPEKEIQGWGENDRGVSYTFGADSVTEFLQKHDLDLICRAHQVRTQGAYVLRIARF